MAFKVSENTRRLANGSIKEPQLILEINGIDRILSTEVVLETIRIGDLDLLIGDDWLIGGLRPVENQNSLISFNGSTTQLSQQIDIDKGRGSSITSMVVSMVDIGNLASEIVSPGVIIDEILSCRCRVYLGFKGSNFPEDYIKIFSGIVGDVDSGAGKVNLTIQSPDTKKRQKLFLPKDTNLVEPIDIDDTTIEVVSTADFLVPIEGPDGIIDESLKFYIRIDDEIIRYTSKDDTHFYECSRAQLGTSAASHSDNAQVNSYFSLGGNAIDLALKLMLSGFNDYFIKDISIASFNYAGTLGSIPNSIFIKDIDLQRTSNIQLGDFIEITNSEEEENNVTQKKIAGIGFIDGGTYLEIDGVTFTNETESLGKLKIRSKWDTLGYGLGMYPDEVDIDQHIEIQSRYLSSFDYLFYLKEEIEDAKEFIEEQIYMPASCFSLPRKAQSSIGILTPPIPGDETIVLNESNILNPEQIKIKRSLNKNFLNTVLYKFDLDALEDDIYRKTYIDLDEDSRNRIQDRGNVVFVIESQGLRSTLDALNIAAQASKRRVDTYKFAAEFLEGVQINYGIGYNKEVGDIIILDSKNLKITNFNTGTRDKPPTLFRIINKKMDIVKGDIKVDLLNTGYGIEQIARYGLIAPSSQIKFAIDNKTIIIKPSYTKDFGTNEGLKWERYPNCAVIIRSEDYSVYASAKIVDVSINQITLDQDLPFLPEENYVIELDTYNSQNEIIKLKYIFMTDEETFEDGKPQYTML